MLQAGICFYKSKVLCVIPQLNGLRFPIHQNYHLAFGITRIIITGVTVGVEPFPVPRDPDVRGVGRHHCWATSVVLPSDLAFVVIAYSHVEISGFCAVEQL